MVEKAQADTKHHVDDTKDNRHLHLKGVEEAQFIGSNVPNLSRPKNQKGVIQSSQMKKYSPILKKFFFCKHTPKYLSPNFNCYLHSSYQLTVNLVSSYPQPAPHLHIILKQIQI